ncbi:ubiquitin-protein ligase [Trifolium medium]|uniref:Ubiquitin-protein ligase n=1 Tax=Trifolium medium TaxID=97028 RepID=A0A392MFD5_9FABA|nr:ubiquitin-protein ligase [Trifolium medium]
MGQSEQIIRLWKVKIEAILFQQKCAEALMGEALMSVNLVQSKKSGMMDKTWSVVIQCLRDKRLMEIAKEKVSLERRW